MSPEFRKCDCGETSLINLSDSLQILESSLTIEEKKEQNQDQKHFSLSKQNKDGANAARTARITIMSMIMSQNKRDVISALRSLKEDIHVKKLMLNIGEKEFINRFLLK